MFFRTRSDTAASSDEPDAEENASEWPWRSTHGWGSGTRETRSRRSSRARETGSRRRRVASSKRSRKKRRACCGLPLLASAALFVLLAYELYRTYGPWRVRVRNTITGSNSNEPQQQQQQFGVRNLSVNALLDRKTEPKRPLLAGMDSRHQQPVSAEDLSAKVVADARSKTAAAHEGHGTERGEKQGAHGMGENAQGATERLRHGMRDDKTSTRFGDGHGDQRHHGLNTDQNSQDHTSHAHDAEYSHHDSEHEHGHDAGEGGIGGQRHELDGEGGDGHGDEGNVEHGHHDGDDTHGDDALPHHHQHDTGTIPEDDGDGNGSGSSSSSSSRANRPEFAGDTAAVREREIREEASDAAPDTVKKKKVSVEGGAHPGASENFWDWFQDNKGRSRLAVKCPERDRRLCRMFYKFLRKYRIRSVFDASCSKNVGWMPAVLKRSSNELWGFKYYCSEPDDERMEMARNALKKFDFVQFTKEFWWKTGFPRNTELVFAWDVLAHTAYGRVWTFFVNIKKNNARYVLVDNYPGILNDPSPERFYLNLRKHPFRFPAAKEVVQNVTEYGETANRQLLFYEVKSLPENL